MQENNTIDAEKQEKIDNVLKSILTEDEVKSYTGLGGALGIMYGLLFTLEKEGVLKAFGEDGAEKIQKAMEVITIYTQKGIESELTTEKATKVRDALVQTGLV